MVDEESDEDVDEVLTQMNPQALFRARYRSANRKKEQETVGSGF